MALTTRSTGPPASGASLACRFAPGFALRRPVTSNVRAHTVTAFARLLAVFLLGAVWPVAVPVLNVLVSFASFTLLSLLPFSEPAHVALADRITSPAISTVLAGVLFGFGLAALARGQQFVILLTFVMAVVLGALVWWPLENYGFATLHEIWTDGPSLASWFGPLVACGVAQVLWNRASNTKRTLNAAP